jgi:quinoprotein glucose dehydrogenase
LDDLSGTPPEFPSLVGIGSKRSREQVLTVITQGRGRMPAFGHIGAEQAQAITDFLVSGEDRGVEAGGETSPYDLPFTHDGYNKFLDPDGYPAIAPPWGTLNAINLDSGDIAWSIPFGEFPELVAQGMTNTGSENYGGPIVTASGLLFIGATKHDRKFHVFDKLTGKLLWETTLPDASGNATPAMYEINGRQFVVIGGSSPTRADGFRVNPDKMVGCGSGSLGRM